MITEADEYAHLPPAGPLERWQENYFIIAWSLESDAGVLLHCKRWPAMGKQVARVVARAHGRTVSRRIEERIPDHLTVGGLTLGIDEPFRKLRLQGTFTGTEGPGPLGFVAWRAGGSTRVDVDLRLSSRLPPADFGAAFELLAASLGGRAGQVAHQSHYEQGGRCEGTIVIDGSPAAVSGLFVRDHTWGPREESAMLAGGYGFWTATVLDGGDRFFNATGAVTPEGTRGVGVVVDVDGQSVTTDITVEFAPRPGLMSFDATRVTIGGDRPVTANGSARTHLVKYLPGSGRGRFDDNAISSVTSTAGTGFGVHEYAGTLPEHQVAELEAAER